MRVVVRARKGDGVWVWVWVRVSTSLRRRQSLSPSIRFHAGWPVTQTRLVLSMQWGGRQVGCQSPDRSSRRCRCRRRRCRRRRSRRGSRSGYCCYGRLHRQSQAQSPSMTVAQPPQHGPARRHAQCKDVHGSFAVLARCRGTWHGTGGCAPISVDNASHCRPNRAALVGRCSAVTLSHSNRCQPTDNPA